MVFYSFFGTWIVILPVRKFQICFNERRCCARHENPLADIGIVGELNLPADKGVLVNNYRVQRICDFDDITFRYPPLKQEAALTHGHHLHFPAAIFTANMRADSHIADVSRLIQIRQAVWSRVRMGVREYGYWKSGHQQRQCQSYGYVLFSFSHSSSLLLSTRQA